MDIPTQDIEKIAACFFIVSVIGLLVAGACNKVVIYYDGWDLAETICSIVLPAIGYGLRDAQPFDTQSLNSAAQFVLGPALIVIGAVLLVRVFWHSIRYNRSVVLGLFVGFYKIVFLLLAVFAVLGSIDKIKDRSSTRGEFRLAALVLSLVIPIAKTLINGKSVHYRKGWLTKNAIA